MFIYYITWLFLCLLKFIFALCSVLSLGFLKNPSDINFGLAPQPKIRMTEVDSALFFYGPSHC
jgi:hypothetical protein